ncbi:MAG: 3-oxoacyl-[acyl-carrier-protein] reductase [Dehalococcoidales bacterium]|nr:3-oxoacyl-[acyl-carrier-protein] reductase [Dehalococcoidales bacterium]
MDLTNKVALVTGSGRGIGQAIGMKLSEVGATVVINDVDEAAANQAAELIKSQQHQSLAIAADVSSADDINRMVETIKRTYGKIDILVNNAGISRDKLVMVMSDEDWDKVLNISLKSAFLCSRAVLRYMVKQRWGRIINISSLAGVVGNAGQANYASAKAGLIGFTKSLAKEIASRNITVNAVAPGFIDTDMTQKLDDKYKDELKKRIPSGTFGSPRDVAEAVAFFASDEAGYITGQVLNIDGGIGGL